MAMQFQTVLVKIQTLHEKAQLEPWNKNKFLTITIISPIFSISNNGHRRRLGRNLTRVSKKSFLTRFVINKKRSE